ncbi:MAG: hypothetical protein QW165_05235 [Candidatus Woesearchaeota archaeon]
MKKSVVILFFLVFLMACARRAAQEPQPQEFRSGTQGLYLQFVPNLPPPRVFDREPLNVMIQVENRGTAPVGMTGLDRIYLSGFDTNIITGIPIDGVDVPPMEGRGPYMPQGGIDTVSFMGRIQSLGARRIDKYQPTLLVTACYHYETIASAQVCIDPNPYAPVSVAKVCTPSTVGTGSQGAPIAVTSVEVAAAPEKTRFKINIANVGGGDVFRVGARYLVACSPYAGGLGFNEIDFLRVADVRISGRSIKDSCKPLDRESHIRLTNGQASLFCEFDAPPGQSAFLTPLEILLDYGYRQSIFRQIDIRPVSG